MQLLDWVLQPIMALLVRRVVSEAEVQTAIRCAESLQEAYAKADQLEAEGYLHLATELRAQADAIDLSKPGQQAVQQASQLFEQPQQVQRLSASTQLSEQNNLPQPKESSTKPTLTRKRKRKTTK